MTPLFPRLRGPLVLAAASMALLACGGTADDRDPGPAPASPDAAATVPQLPPSPASQAHAEPVHAPAAPPPTMAAPLRLPPTAAAAVQAAPGLAALQAGLAQLQRELAELRQHSAALAERLDERTAQAPMQGDADPATPSHTAHAAGRAPLP